MVALLDIDFAGSVLFGASADLFGGGVCWLVAAEAPFAALNVGFGVPWVPFVPLVDTLDTTAADD